MAHIVEICPSARLRDRLADGIEIVAEAGHYRLNVPPEAQIRGGHGHNVVGHGGGERQTLLRVLREG